MSREVMQAAEEALAAMYDVIERLEFVAGTPRPPNAPSQVARAKADALRLALASAQQPAQGELPPRWKMVPVWATPEMQDAGERAFVATAAPGATWAEHTAHVWAAMLAAAPRTPATTGDEGLTWELS